MSFMSSASGASRWRGYEYYKGKNVKSIVKLSNSEYEGTVAGSQSEPYHVKINLSHVRQSKCNCPHAEGNRVTCKHMIALFFAAFPTEADNFMKEVEEYERGEAERERQRYEEIKKYVYRLSKEELRQELMNYMIEYEGNRHYW